MKVKVKRELNVEDLKLIREAIQNKIKNRNSTLDSFDYIKFHHPFESVCGMVYTLPAEMVMKIKNKRDKKRIEKIEKLKILYQNGHKENIKVKCKCRI